MASFKQHFLAWAFGMMAFWWSNALSPDAHEHSSQSTIGASIAIEVGMSHHGVVPTVPVATDNTTLSGVATVKFAVLGDTQGGEQGGHANLLSRLVESIAAHDVEYVLFPGDLVADSGIDGWKAWRSRTDVLGVNSMGRDKRLMTPGNHDRGTGGDFAAWQRTFSWLPDCQPLNGEQGIDKVDYFVDYRGIRFVSISSDAPGQIYNARVVDNAPPALDWLREVMRDVDARNGDADSTNDISHVFTFSHRPVTTQRESPTGGINGSWWKSMTGQDPASGRHITAALLPGHWHMYQPSRPDPRVPTMEIISGTGGGGLEGQPHRNWHGYSIITVQGDLVTSSFYGDTDHSTDDWNFRLLDTFAIRTPGGQPTGELASYRFESGAPRQDSSRSALSKQLPLAFRQGAVATSDPQRGSVLDVRGPGYADLKHVGDNNMAVLGSLTIKVAARLCSLDTAAEDATLVAFGGAHGSRNGTLEAQECANTVYRLSMSPEGHLKLSWQHSGGHWVTIATKDAVETPLMWHEYEVRRDAMQRRVAFLLDGRPFGDPLEFQQLPTGGGSGSLYIGADVGGEHPFDGFLDELTINNADPKPIE